MTIRVLLVDDQTLVRAGLRMVLSAAEGIEVVGEAGDGQQGVALCRQLSADVVVMDIRMPVLDGIGATAIITAMPDPPGVLVLTTFDLDEYVYGALRAGASGFLLKDAPEQQLIDAIRVLHGGASLFAPTATRRLVAHFATLPDRVEPPAARAQSWVGSVGLTDREVEVLTLVATGAANAEIAATLYISEATVKTHVARLLFKLGARSRTHAVVMAYENGLVGRGAPAAPQPSGTIRPDS
jgi:DNA-binding NarL/FixJ family response regulator